MLRREVGSAQAPREAGVEAERSVPEVFPEAKVSSRRGEQSHRFHQVLPVRCRLPAAKDLSSLSLQSDLYQGLALWLHQGKPGRSPESVPSPRAG